jgi:energy-coupling factor transporter transmembrane protein EcfT
MRAAVTPRTVFILVILLLEAVMVMRELVFLGAAFAATPIR